MRHATESDLDRLATLLGHLRDRPELHERKPGYFSRGSRAFLHVHADGDDLYVDARLGASFERVRVTTPEEQHGFLVRVQQSLEGQP